jgi:hypothetical protein
MQKQKVGLRKTEGSSTGDSFCGIIYYSFKLSPRSADGLRPAAAAAAASTSERAASAVEQYVALPRDRGDAGSRWGSKCGMWSADADACNMGMAVGGLDASCSVT